MEQVRYERSAVVSACLMGRKHRVALTMVGLACCFLSRMPVYGHACAARPVCRMDPQGRRQDHHPRLTQDELAEYQPLFDNAKKLRLLLAELQDLTLEIIGADSSPGPQSPPEP